GRRNQQMQKKLLFRKAQLRKRLINQVPDERSVLHSITKQPIFGKTDTLKK
ncbi:MAG: hypothetical protein ACJAQ2_001222, partial [Vicingaceae bacterium]